MYKKALELDPANANNTGNYAGLLLAMGKKEGFELLKRALNLAEDNHVLTLESHFYQYAHTEDEIIQDESLAKIKELIETGVRSPGWDLTDNVNRAISDKHPQPEFLKALAKVIADETDSNELDKFDVWKK